MAMRQWSDPAALAASQRRRFRLTWQSWQIEHRRMAELLYGDMQKRTSGRVSTATLRRLGHPFSRAKARGFKGGVSGRVKAMGVPKLPINRQTGRLQQSLRMTKVSGGIQSYRLEFMAPHARYVLAQRGTRKMVARGFWTAVKTDWESRNRQLYYDMKLRQLQIMYGRG
jgi:hypothetical protein